MKEINEVIIEALQSDLDRRVRERRNEIVTSLMAWLTSGTKLKPVPDLDQRLAQMQKRLERMVTGIKVRLESGAVLIKVNGSDEETLKMLRLGSAWFEGDPDLVERVIAGLFDAA